MFSFIELTTFSVKIFVAVDFVLTLQNHHQVEIVKIFVHNSSILSVIDFWDQFQMAVKIITDETHIIIQSILKLDLSLLALIDSKEFIIFSNIEIIKIKLKGKRLKVKD